MSPALGVLEAASMSVVSGDRLNPQETLVKGYPLSSSSSAANQTAPANQTVSANQTAPFDAAAVSFSAAESDSCAAPAQTAASSNVHPSKGSSTSAAPGYTNLEPASGASGTAPGVGAGDDEEKKEVDLEFGDDSGLEEAEIRAAAASFGTLVGGGAWGPLGDPLGPGAHCNARILWQQRAFTWACSTLAEQATEVLTAEIVTSCRCDLPACS